MKWFWNGLQHISASDLERVATKSCDEGSTVGMTIRISLMATLCVLVLSCASSDSGAIDSTSVQSNTGAPSAAPEPDAGRSLEIYIDSVLPANPLVVFGRARTFENTVQVRVRDAGGNVVAAEHTTSVGETGHHNPYTAQLWIVRDPGPRLTVEAFEYSAADGSVRSLTNKVAPYDGGRMQVTLDLPVGNDCIVLTVDFNERLRNVGGSCAATAIRRSVTRTLQRLPAVKRVVITAAGSEKLALQP
jgi:hypothetical protein